MQTIQISDSAAQQLNILAEQQHISSCDLIERMIRQYGMEQAKIRDLKDFFKPFQTDMTGFQFDREEANAR